MMIIAWPLSSNDKKKKKKKKLGLACLSKERRTEIARMGELARAKKWREKRWQQYKTTL